jgi:hypothetical protein
LKKNGRKSDRFQLKEEDVNKKKEKKIDLSGSEAGIINYKGTALCQRDSLCALFV